MNARWLAGVVLLSGSLAATWTGCTTEVTRVVDDDEGSGGAGGGISVGGGMTSGGGAQPPPPPDGGVPGDGPGYLFAINRLHMGLEDANGTPNPSAWKQYGYNIDGRISTADSTDLCQPLAGGSKSAVYPDGDGGIDNAWGKLLLPIIAGLSQDYESQLNASLRSGAFTELFRVDTLGSQANYVGLSVGTYEGAPWDVGIPSWNASDIWDVTAESVSGGNIDAPLYAFTGSYVNGNTLVSAPLGTLDFGLGDGQLLMPVRIERAVVTMNLSADRTTASRGVIAGIVQVETFIEEMRRIAGSFDPSLCAGTTFDSIADQIRQAADILSDGSQDPSRTCDAISIGMGFEATAVQLGTVAAPLPPPPDPCAPMP